MPAPNPGLSPLADTAIIAVAGSDARTFLHSQLSVSFTDLKQDEARLAAWHDPRGRVRAIFHVVPTNEGWLLLTSAELAAPILTKLRLFVLRAKVTLALADAELRAYAILGRADAWLASEELDLAEAPKSLIYARGVNWLRIGPELIYAIGPATAVESVCAELTPSPADSAELAAIRCGIPRIGAALTEQYIPQMLNLDVLGAVSFNKGCYPGQEVITRTHNLGTVKRKMRRFAAAIDTVPAPGTALLAGDGESAGEVVRAARAEPGIELLAVVRLDRLSEPLSIAGSETELTELALPY